MVWRWLNHRRVCGGRLWPRPVASLGAVLVNVRCRFRSHAPSCSPQQRIWCHLLFNRRDDHAMHDFTRSAVLPPGCVGVTIAVKLQHHGYGGQDDSSDNDDDVSALDSVRFKLVTVTAGVRCVAVCVHSYTLSSPSRSILPRTMRAGCAHVAQVQRQTVS